MLRLNRCGTFGLLAKRGRAFQLAPSGNIERSQTFDQTDTNGRHKDSEHGGYRENNPPGSPSGPVAVKTAERAQRYRDSLQHDGCGEKHDDQIPSRGKADRADNEKDGTDQQR